MPSADLLQAELQQESTSLDSKSHLATTSGVNVRERK